MNNSKNIRRLSLLLAIITLISVMPVQAFSAEELAPVRILHQGEEISSLILYQDDKQKLEVETSLKGTLSYQWQIMTNGINPTWVKISGMTSKSCDVSYALIASLLDTSGQVQLRCTVSNGTDLYTSESVIVTVSYTAADIGTKPVTYSTPKKSAPMFAAPKSVAAADNEIKDIYNITINYVYRDGSIARDPNVLTIAAGTPARHTIPNPVIPGYKPVLQEQYPDVSIVHDEENDSSSTVLDYESLDAPKVINVVYEPDIVKYHVYHYKQNVYDDNYSTDPVIVEMEGYTGDVIADCHMEIDGFHSLYYERMVIAADGSTQVDIYYDRNYYLVSFDLGGGFGVDPIYTRYGSEISVNTPSRAGYVFNSWSLISVAGHTPTADDIGKYLFTDVNNVVTVESALSYLATWNRGKTSYTMVFWQENPNDNGYSYWGSVTVDTDSTGRDLLVGDSVSAQDWVSRVPTITDEQYFTYNPSRSDHNVVLEGDGSSIVNVYYTRNRYTITFIAPGKCAIEAGHTHSGDCYYDICGQNHIHTELCERHMICTLPEHTEHSSDCLECGIEEHVHGIHCSGATDCGKEEHTHSPDCCSLTEHSHSTNCYPNVGSSVTEPATAGRPNYDRFPTYVTNGYIARFKRGSTYYHYIYINGKWYIYTRSANNGTIVKINCGLSEHTHGNTGCIHCSQEEHIHTSDCTTCDKVEHIHGENCYKDHIHTHTEECYEYPNCEQHIHEDSCMLLVCDMPTGHTHSSSCSDSGRNSTVKILTRKYQASLGDIWPVVDDNGVIYNSGQRWTPSNSSYYSQVLVYISSMPADDFTLTVNTSSYNTFRMHYMLEVLPGQEYTHTYNGKNFTESFVVNANYNYITRDEDFFDIKGFEQYGSNPAFTNNKIERNGGDVYFYYKRNTDGLIFSFHNVNNVIQSYSGDNIMYGIPLTDYQNQADGTPFVPPYPETYEPKAYKFDKWYTTPECFPGTEVNWDKLTMPDGALTLYSHWIPTKHSVNIFKDATLTEPLCATLEVDHGTLIPDPGHPSNGQLIFSGWFYKDSNGEEKAFIFNGIPVKDDINIYAKWESRVAVKYTIYYKTVNADGTESDVAPPTVGSTIAGQNRTFDAYGGTDLYAEYREGFFPDSSSHSIIMSAENENTHTFYYKKLDGVPYKVRYLDEHGNSLIQDKVVSDNKLSVVTETFVTIQGYMPDSYQKRLVISANEAENILTFTYTKDETHAYYRVVHYWQNLDGQGYTEHSYSDIKATIGSVCAASPITITGFTFKEAKIDGNTVNLNNDHSVSGTLDEDGMLIAFYYDRQTVSYNIDYVEYRNESNHLSASVTKTGLFGETVQESALDLTAIGYTRVSDQVQRITLRENGRNNIVFKYQENTVGYQYIAVMGDKINPLYGSENVNARTGTATGFAPIASQDYTFVGWFMDEACTVPVDSSLVDESGKLVPQRTDTNGDGIYLYDGGIYYAKFNYNFSALTIKVEGCLDDEQVFLFEIKGVDGTATKDIRFIVAIKSNSSVTIDNVFVGEYDITELTDWSWRYDPNGDASVHVNTSTLNGILTFTQSVTNDKWLDGNGYSQFPIQ